MDDFSDVAGEENEEATDSDRMGDQVPPVPPAGLGYRDDCLWIAGQHISVYDCPECLEHDDFDCSQCEFFPPESCQIRRQPVLLYDLRTIRSIYLERRTVSSRQRAELIRAISSELETHGRPLHYSVLARIVADRHPSLRVSEQRVLRIMAACTELFERVTEGVYSYKSSNEG